MTLVVPVRAVLLAVAAHRDGQAGAHVATEARTRCGRWNCGLGGAVQYGFDPREEAIDGGEDAGKAGIATAGTVAGHAHQNLQWSRDVLTKIFRLQ